MNEKPARISSVITSENIYFGIATCFLAVIAHAIAYLAHEYLHSFVAWGLGWMANPLALDYGPPTLYNFIFLGEVEDNVSYGPIFSSGHGISAAIIALAGPFLGNGLLYFLLYLAAKSRVIANSRAGMSFIFWVALMCAGNVWSYVPIRAITTHADIALAAKGLQISPWTLFPFLIVPSLFVVYHFFCRMFLISYRKITADSGNNLALLIAATAFWYFFFFGGDGVSGSYGLISQLLSIASKYFLFPLSAMYLASRYGLIFKDDRQFQSSPEP